MSATCRLGGPPFWVSGSSRGRVTGNLPSCGTPCGAAPLVCPNLPCVPPQGAVMPVLYNPGHATNLNVLSPSAASVYTLNIITTAVIPQGVLLRFQMYDGVGLTYSAAVASSAIAQWDLVVSTTIPIGTTCAVVVTASSTSIVKYSGTTVYASGGPGVLTALLQPTNSCLCWAFAPTAQGAWIPATGQPQFAIGFSDSATNAGTACPAAPTTGAALTAPNFPDQWCLSSGITWTFLYEIVFPVQYAVETVEGPVTLEECFPVTAFKVGFDASYPVYATSEWSNLRDILSQPWTVVTPTAVTPSRWQAFDGTGFSDNPNVGPFEVAAGPGQLAVVFFQPRHQNLWSNEIAVAGPPTYTGTDYLGPGKLGLLVTSPIAAGSTLQITFQPFNSYYGAFGPRDPDPTPSTASRACGSAVFVDANPDIVWTVGPFVIPAGTVLFLENLGTSSLPSICDAQNTSGNRVGSLSCPNGLSERSVDSVTIVSNWQTTGTGTIRPILADRFVTAILSTDYCGDQPLLSPMLTMQRTRVSTAVGYMLNRVIDSSNLPGTVQAALINSATLTPLTYAESLLTTAADMPVFTGMTSFYW